MQYGDEINVLENGPIIDAKSLQPLGIADDSVCWGLWVGGEPVRNKSRQKQHWHLPHLVVSPIHPDNWATSFHMRVVLRDNQGSMYRFLDSIRECGVDLHFVDYAFSGYDHSVMNAMAHFEDLRHWRMEFVKYYADNCKVFNERWHRADKNDQHSREASHNGDSCDEPEYTESLIFALQVPQQEADHVLKAIKDNRECQKNGEKCKTIQQIQASQSAIDLMRRNAFEWLGRKMLARLTALWVISRRSEYFVYSEAWEKASELDGRPPLDAMMRFQQWPIPFDVDPPGDYWFSSKSIQTGGRPWNIEMPFTASWRKNNPDESDRCSSKFVKEAWKEYPEILKEFENEKPEWFSNGEEVISELYKQVKSTRDLIHALRDPENMTRATRQAAVARQHDCQNSWINAVIEQTVRNNWITPYSYHALYELAYASIWQRNKVPIEFRYVADQSQLVVQNPEALRGAMSNFWSDARNQDEQGEIHPMFPRVAIASFNTKERFVRLRFIERHISDSQFVSIAIKFEVSPREKKLACPGRLGQDYQDVVNRSHTHDETPADSIDMEKSSAPDRKGDPAVTETVSSQGLIRVLCKAALEMKLSLKRVSTRVRAMYPKRVGAEMRERGEIKMVVEMPRPMQPGDLARIERYLNECIYGYDNELPFRNHISLAAKAIPWQTTQVFWSSVFTHDRHEEVFNLVRNSGKTYGMNVVKAQSRINEITRHVCTAIEQSDAVLQFVCLRDTGFLDTNNNGARDDAFVWLHTEYAMALALNKPIVRMIDVSVPEKIRRDFCKVDRDVPIEQIDLRWSKKTLEGRIEEVMGELRAKLSEGKKQGRDWSRSGSVSDGWHAEWTESDGGL